LSTGRLVISVADTKPVSKVDPAFYPLWEGKMIITIRAE